ncbi:DNA-binding protein [Enterococcus sp. JM4C]|uniref:transcription repressor NadR n=1 Tax=Candidatus Enterococcus huntleyi TaxID=1857217 RepID=UPI00137A6C1C|nr:transcription repressor NadR [Enterococcus sp. JM4C]KAF1299137.1 DNA-binding protein [Enterococcus sp. JM4C]
MIEGSTRRSEIIRQLSVSEKPISASKFAKQFGVSRQIVVGDIALMRASGEGIVATARGYVLEKAKSAEGLLSKIAVQHGPEDTRNELELIIKQGGEIIDVIVEHPIYGELVGGLHLKTLKDVDLFMKSYEEGQGSLLSQLTEGIHLHTIRYQEERQFEAIKQALLDANILYQSE